MTTAAKTEFIQGILDKYSEIVWDDSAHVKLVEIETLFTELREGKRTEVEDQAKVLAEMEKSLHENFQYLNDYSSHTYKGTLTQNFDEADGILFLQEARESEPTKIERWRMEQILSPDGMEIRMDDRVPSGTEVHVRVKRAFRTHLYNDFALCSFSVVWARESTGERFMQGGLIFHGSNQETFSVTIGAFKWWRVHT